MTPLIYSSFDSLRTLRRAACLALLTIASLASSRVLAVEPALIVTIKSFGEIEKDVAYLGTALQQPFLAAAFPGLVAQFTAGKGLAGLDVEQPIGGFLTLSAEGQPGDVVVILPVSDQKTFAATLAAIFPNPKTANGLTQYQQPGSGNQFFAKEGAKHFIFSTNAAALAEKIEPDKILKPTADIGVDFDLTKVPDPLKEQFLNLVAAQAAAAAAQQAESIPESRQRGEKLGREMSLKAFRALVMEGNFLNLGLTVDSKAKSVSLDAGFTTRPKTALAAACASYAGLESPYSGLVKANTFASLLISVPLGKEAQHMLVFAFEQAEKGAAAGAAKANPEERKVAERLTRQFVESMRKAVQLDRWDQALVVNTTKPGQIQVVAVSRVSEGNNLADVFEQIIRNDTDAGKRIDLNVARVGGARIHAITVPPETDFEKHFGSNPLHVAISNDAAWLVFGGDALADLKTALASKPAKTTRAPISLRIGMAKLWDLVQSANPALQQIGKMAFDGAGDELALEVAAQPQGLKLHLEIQEGVLRLIGMSAAQLRQR